MIRTIFLFIAFIFCWSPTPGQEIDRATDSVKSSANARDSVYEAWVARYNGGVNASDGAIDVAVDVSGNVYVTGGTSYPLGGPPWDYVTIKYDASGGERWVARYNGPGNSYDQARALTLDHSGNVYVTGTSAGGSVTSDDYATIKYNPLGVVQWIARYNGPGNSYDYGVEVAVDASHNVYVTGNSGDGGDYTTVKYDSSGVEQWVARHDGIGYSHDIVRDLAIDDSGNVYVTGEGYSSIPVSDYVTIKYNVFGEEQWIARYDGTYHADDWAVAIAADDSGNAYVTGRSRGSNEAFDYATIKYDSDGGEEWVARYNGPTDGYDEAQDLFADGLGNVYVTGNSSGSGTSYDYTTIGYDGSGAELWLARYDGPDNGNDYASALAIDGSGNVFVTGWAQTSATDRDYATIKYDSAGSEEWVALYDGPGGVSGYEWDYASAIAADALGNIYVTGQSFGPEGFYDCATIKYRQLSTSVRDEVDTPDDFNLSQNYPNPFNPSTTIQFALQRSSEVSLTIFNLLGEEVATLYSGHKDAGTHTIQWDATGQPSGVYFYRLQAGGFTETRKLVLLR